MKRRSPLVLLFTLAFGLASCGDDPATANTTANGSIAAKVAGESWSATSVQASWQSNVLSLGGAQINGSVNRQINISAMIQAPGTYQINPFAGMTAAYTEGSGTSVKIYSATGGELVVTTLTAGGAKGTFTFTGAESQGGTGTKSITEGSFDVKF